MCCLDDSVIRLSGYDLSEGVSVVCGCWFNTMDVCVFFFKQKTAYGIMPSLVGSEMCIRESIKTTSPQGVLTFSLHAWIASQGVATFQSQENVATYVVTKVVTGRCVGRCVARLRRNVRRKVVATFSLQTYPPSQGPRRNVRRKVVARFRRKV